MKKYFLFVLFFTIVFVCGCHYADSEQPADIAQWITYDDIMVGSSTLENVEALHGQPNDKDAFEDSVQIFYYDGYHFIAQDDTVKTILIESSEAPLLWDKISIGSSLDTVLSVLPVTPIEVEYDVTSPPSDLPGDTGEQYGLLITAYDGTPAKICDKQIIFVVSPQYMITFQIDTEHNTITSISLAG